jgi:hypothetical protein
MLCPLSFSIQIPRIATIVNPASIGVQTRKMERRSWMAAGKLPRAEAALHPDRVRRSSQETRAASGLNDPNILTVHDAGEFEGGPLL